MSVTNEKLPQDIQRRIWFAKIEQAKQSLQPFLADVNAQFNSSLADLSVNKAIDDAFASLDAIVVDYFPDVN